MTTPTGFDEAERQRLGQQLKFLAQQQGLSQHQLAHAASLSVSCVSKAWRGQTAKPTHYQALARALDTSLEALTTTSDSTPSSLAATRPATTRTARGITVASRKGGTAKTTTTVHLAGGLARRGYRVLLVDLDAQMDATEWMLAPEAEIGLTSHEVLCDSASPSACILPSWLENLDVLPASSELDGVARTTAQDFGVERQLAALMPEVAHRYDFILYDTPAAFDVRTVNALMASRWVIVPSQPGPLDLKGLFNFLPQVLKFTDPHRFNAKLKLLGILLCRVKDQTVMAREASDFLGQEFGGLVCQQMISDTIRYQEVSAHKALIADWEARYAPEYEAVLDELLGRMAQQDAALEALRAI